MQGTLVMTLSLNEYLQSVSRIEKKTKKNTVFVSALWAKSWPKAPG
jgi:hypothetical protein